MTDIEYQDVVKIMKDTGLTVETYPQTRLINVTDPNGIIQSYYASTGTAIFRDSNYSRTSKKKIIKCLRPYKFSFICEKGMAKELFFQGE